MAAPRRQARSKSLARAVAYRHPEVIHRFVDTWNVTPAEARAIFDDTKRYLWLVSQPGNGAIPPILIIDEMWHTFLMYTVEYTHWSQTYLGRFLHHVPTAKRTKLAMQRQFARDPRRATAHAREVLSRNLTTLYAALGKACVVRWYVEYADRYGEEFFRTARRPFEDSGWRVPPELRKLVRRR